MHNTACLHVQNEPVLLRNLKFKKPRLARCITIKVMKPTLLDDSVNMCLSTELMQIKLGILMSSVKQFKTVIMMIL